MQKRISDMSIKNWVEAIAGVLVFCGVVLFVTGIVIDHFKDASQAKNFSTMISFWKKGLMCTIFGLVILILSTIIGPNQRK